MVDKEAVCRGVWYADIDPPEALLGAPLRVTVICNRAASHADEGIRHGGLVDGHPGSLEVEWDVPSSPEKDS